MSSSSISSSSSSSCSSLSSGSMHYPATQTIPITVDVFSQRAHPPLSSSLASYDVSERAGSKETCVFKETVEGIGPKYIHEKSVTLQFIQRLITFLNQGSKKPLSMEIISHLTLKEVIDLGYIKLISILTSKTHGDLGIELMKKVRSLNEEDEDFQKHIQEITELTKKLAGENPAKELIAFKGVLEFLLKCKSEYILKISPTQQLEQENQLKIIYFVLEMLTVELKIPDGIEITESITVQYASKQHDENIQITSNLIFYIIKWFKNFQDKLNTALDSKEQPLLKVDQFLKTAKGFEVNVLPYLKKDISDLEFNLLSLARMGFGETSNVITQKAMKEVRLIIAEKISQFFEQLAVEIEPLIEKYSKVEGFTGSTLYTAISEMLIHIAHEDISPELQAKMTQFSPSFVGPTHNLKIENVNEIQKPKKLKGKGKKKKQEKKEKQELPLFLIRSPETIAIEKELRKICLSKFEKFISSFFSFLKKIEIPEILNFIKDSFGPGQIKITLSRTVQSLFESSSTSLQYKKESPTDVIEFIRKVGAKAILEAKSDQAETFWSYPEFMKYAYIVSQLNITTNDAVEKVEKTLQYIVDFHLKISRFLESRKLLFNTYQKVIGLFLPQLHTLRNSQEPRDNLSWMDWIDAEEELIERGNKKEVNEKKSSIEESSEDEEVESEKSLEFVSSAYVPLVREKQIHCDVTSLVTIVDATRKLFSHFYGMDSLIPSKSSTKLSGSEIAQSQQIYALNEVIALLNAMRSTDDPRILEKLLSQFFHFGHMAIEQGATSHYLKRHPNRLNIPHNINQLLSDLRCRLRNRWTENCPSASLYLRYPFSFEHRASSPLALRHMAKPQPNTIREASPQNLRLWVIDLVGTHLEMLEKTLPKEMKAQLQTFKKEFDGFVHAPAQESAQASLKNKLTPFDSKALDESSGILHTALDELSQFLRNRRLPVDQRRWFENALHHLRTLSEEPYILSKLPDQEFLSIHGHRYLIAIQYFTENIGMGLIYDQDHTEFTTHDLNIIFRTLDLTEHLSPEQITYLRSLNVFKGSEYTIKYFARLKKRGDEFSTMNFMDRLYTFSQAGEEFTPAGKAKENLHQKLSTELKSAALLAQGLVRLVIQRIQAGASRRSSGATSSRRSSGAASAAAVSEEKS